MRESARRAVESAVVCASVVAIALAAAQVLTFGYGRDQGIYAMVARAILRGGMPYRDAWDFKTPGIFLVFAAARAAFGASEAGVRVIEVLGLALMARSIVRLLTRATGDRTAGFLAAAIAVVAHTELDFWHTAQPESFGGMLTIFALDLAAPTLATPDARDRGHLLRWLGVGALFGLAGLMKPPLAGGALVVAIDLARAGRRRVAPALVIGAGVVLPIALTLAWFAARGALGDLAAVLFGFTPHYTALSWAGEGVVRMLGYAVTDWLSGYSSLASAGVFLLIVTRDPWPSRSARRFIDVVLGVIAVQLVGVAMQGKFFPYHYGATWPLTAILGGVGYARVLRAAERRSAWAAAAFFPFVVGITALRGSVRDTSDSFLARSLERARLFTIDRDNQAEIDRLASVADVDAGANRAVAAWIAARTRPDQRVLVWGFEPVIYDLAGRAPATRYLYDVPQRVAWGRAASRAQLLRDLARTPAAVVVVEHGDVFPAVTGDDLDSAEALVDFPALRALLRDRYRLEATIRQFDVYRRAED